MGTKPIADGKIVIGLVEKVSIKADGKKAMTIDAKIDTGATKSSMDINLANRLELGPIIKSKVIKSAHGNKLRPIIEADIRIAGINMRSEFTLADRSHLKYIMLIGQDILKNGFLIDPNK
ncbi:ATP-dependent zinc protease [Candidatus Woesearchaeota archaeon]|nr:ATP-dependent zinc protease [Candidatus Woesearchaeota archaeon]